MAGQTPALQQQNSLRKNAIFNEHPVQKHCDAVLCWWRPSHVAGSTDYVSEGGRGSM